MFSSYTILHHLLSSQFYLPRDMPNKGHPAAESVQPGHPETTPNNSINALQTLFKEFTRAGHFESLNTVINDNEVLKNKCVTLQTAYNTNLDALASKSNKLADLKREHKQALDTQHERVTELVDAKKTSDSELEKERQKLADKRAQVKEQEEQIKKLIKDVKHGETMIQQLENVKQQKDDLEGQLAAVKHDLSAKVTELSQSSESLRVIQSFVIQLTTIQDAKVNVYVWSDKRVLPRIRIGSKHTMSRPWLTSHTLHRRDDLEAMFRESHRLMQQWLSHDLPDGCLTDTKLWDAIRTHPSIHRAIPLAPLNSKSAKSMRVAAGLLIFSQAVANHIMRPTYIVQDDAAHNELADLARQNLDLATYVRAVLLRALPGRQRAGQNDAIKTVIKDAAKVVAPWVAEGQREAFYSDLERVTGKIAASWAHVQTLEENVKPIFESDYDDDWRPLPAPPTDPNPQPSSQKGTKQRQKQDPPVHKQPASETVTINVWPSCILADDRENTDALISRGFGLTAAQMAEAEDELSRRTARKAARQEVPTGSKKRRDSAISLFTKDTNGSSAM